MKLKNKVIAVILLLCPIVMFGQARPATCRIFHLSVGTDGIGRSSYSKDIGSFQTDGNEGKTIRSFNYKDLVITAGIDYVFDYSPKSKTTPYAIDLAITASDKEDKQLFESVNTAEASTLYAKKWNLSVTKNINFDNAIYMFTLSCGDGFRTPRRK